MLILVIDTAGPEGGVLLARNESASCDLDKTDVLGASTLEPRKFSQQLISAITELLRRNSLALINVDAFAVISGPGSFTGLRVGLSAVKALAEVTLKPIIALSRLAILASASEAYCSRQSVDGPIHAVLDAGRGEFYHGIYRDSGWICVVESLETLPALQASVRNAPGPIAVFEPGVFEALKTTFSPTPCRLPSLSVQEALPLALASWRAQRFTGVAELDANYLRRMVPKAISGVEVTTKSVEERNPGL